MFCAKCGSQNSDRSMFCINCGAPLKESGRNAGPGVRNAAPVNPGIRSAASAAPAFGARASGGLSESLRSLILSPLFLTAAIALSVQVLMSIIAAASGYSPYSALINNILNNPELGYYVNPQEYYAVMGVMNRVGTAGAIIANIPVIVITAGLWILFAQARSQSQRMTATGITMIRVVVIVQFVLFAIGFLLGIVSLFIGLAALSREVENAALIVIVCLIIFALVGYLTFSYYIKVIKMLGSARDVIMIGRKTAPAYLYVMVLTFIGAGFQCISAFGSLFSAGILGFLSTAAAAVFGICCGLLMNRFNTLEGTAPAQGRPEVNVAVQIQPGAPYNAPMRNQAPEAPMNSPAPGAPMNSPVPGAPMNSPASGAPMNSPVPGAPMNSPAQNGPVQAPPFGSPMQQGSPAPNLPPFIPPKPGTIVMNFDEEEDKRRRYANEGTMVLNNDNFVMPPAKLIRVGDQKEFPVTKPQFTIGKAYGNVDCFIDGNPAISRKHAMIEYKDGKFYIVDTRSTNHVFLDGKMIPVDTPVPLEYGTKIRFADEIYLFSE